MKNIEDYKEKLRTAIEQGRDTDWVYNGEDERAVQTFETSWALDAVMEVIKEILVEPPVTRSIPEPELRRIFEVYKPPFKYNDDFQAIVDAKDDIVTTHIRGWAFLQKLPDGIQIQDNIGKLIAELLNKEYERIKAG